MNGENDADTSSRLLAAALAVAASLVTPALARAQQKKPNILVIFGDDVGRGTWARTPTA